MATISATDILFASATQGGRHLADLRISGISCTSNIIGELRRAMHGVLGIVQVRLRNATQGWSRTMSLYLDAYPEGVQLTLF
ncbi:MAG: hypothetical protein K2F97_07900 [Muribaculaceae bacterium]|nr:hypothetical protein [Muribaculaceae bacterium]MDE6487111.1 hypothetical protein [Muribaculaceae bacterium]